MLRKDWSKLAALAVLLVLAVSCAPGDIRWSADARAGFWAGLWHGFIIVITFIVSLFNTDVRIYEAHNAGWTYNLGFLLGAMISLGGGARASVQKRRKRGCDDIGERVAVSVRQQIADEVKEDIEWDAFSRKVEDRIKEEFRRHRD